MGAWGDAVNRHKVMMVVVGELVGVMVALMVVCWLAAAAVIKRALTHKSSNGEGMCTHTHNARTHTHTRARQNIAHLVRRPFRRHLHLALPVAVVAVAVAVAVRPVPVRRPHQPRHGHA